MITEDYVSFETAKLLKEKGFDEYGFNGYIKYKYVKEFDTYLQTSEYVDYNFKKYYYPCPTLQMAMKWLREVHNIFIGISVCERYENKTDLEPIVMFFFELLNLKEKQIINGYSQEYVHTYEEACEAAIKYCLENLI